MQKTLSYSKEITRALDEKLSEDRWNVILLGEDIRDPYGGCFNITRGLSTKYNDKVINTPISESAICGMSIGMAMRGFRPVFEIMFGDFITLCVDQIINHAAKFEWMYNNQVSVPMTIRLPSGGHRGYGPTHSQTLERLFLGVPGLEIVAPSHFHDVNKLLHDAIESDKPTLFVENKVLYTKPLYRFYKHKDKFTVHTSSEKYPTVEIFTSPKPDILLCCYGGVLVPTIDGVCDVLDTNPDLKISIICPSSLSSGTLTIDFMKHGPHGKTVIFIEEDYGQGGWVNSLEVVPTPIYHLTNVNVPIGNATTLENDTLIGAKDVAKTIRSLLWVENQK